MIERIRNLNRRLLDYNELPDRKETEKLPLHIIKRRSYYNQRHLVVLGVHHRTDPKDSQFSTIRQEFTSWLEKTQDTKRIIIVEGRIAKQGIDEDSSISTEGGEMALIAYWANKHKIEIKSGEPQPQWSEANEVAELFDRDEEVIKKGLTGKDITAYYYFARHLPQWYRTPPDKKLDINSYMKQTIDIHQKAWRWEDFDFSLDNFLRIHKKLYTKPLDLDHIDNDFFLDQTVNFKQDKTPTQRVARAVNDMRDRNLANLYAECWDRGINVFSAFGLSHILRMDPVLTNFGVSDK